MVDPVIPLGENVKLKSSLSLGYCKLILLSFFIFAILYNVSFKALPSLTLGRLGIIGLVVWAFFLGKNPFVLLRTKALLLFLPVPYVAVQFYFIGDYGQLSRFVNLFIYAYLGAALIAVIASDTKLVLKALMIAIFLQSIVIIYSFFNFDYRTWIDLITVNDSNYDAFNLYRAPGFSGASGAALSLIQGMGVLVGWLLFEQALVGNKPIRGFSVYGVYFAMVLCVISCIVVGRTGTVLSIIFLAIFMVSQRVNLKFIFFVVFSICSYFFIKNNFSNNLLSNDFSTDFFTTWAFGFLSGNDGTVHALREMPIPPLSADTFFGTGLVSILNGANPSGNDSGFIQAYYSMGLPMVTLLYVTYLMILFRITGWASPYVRILLVVVFFSLDTKEPFLFKYSLMFILLSIYFSYVLHKRNTRDHYEDNIIY